MPYTIHERSSIVPWRPLETDAGDTLIDVMTSDLGEARDTAIWHVWDAESDWESRVIDLDTGIILHHFTLQHEQVIDLLAPPAWVVALRTAYAECERAESMSDALIAEHQLAAVVFQFRAEIMGEWA